MAVDNRHSRHWLFAAGATGFAALLIACGSSGGDSPATPSDSAAPSTQAASPLPDGQQLVFLRSLDLGGHTAVVDPVEMLTGDAAHDACVADHADEPDLCELDYYIANPAEESITVPVSADADYVAAMTDSVAGAEAPGPTGWMQVDGEWNCQNDVEVGCPTTAERFASIGQDMMLVNLTIEGGSVTVLVHVYTP